MAEFDKIKASSENTKYKTFKRILKPYVYGFLIVSGLIMSSVILSIDESNTWQEVKPIMLIVQPISLIAIIFGVFGLTKYKILEEIKNSNKE